MRLPRMLLTLFIRRVSVVFSQTQTSSQTSQTSKKVPALTVRVLIMDINTPQPAQLRTEEKSRRFSLFSSPLLRKNSLGF